MTTLEEAGQELGPYSEVSDGLIVEAVDRAMHHEQDEEVLTSVLSEHLGFVPEPDTNRPLVPRLEGLRRAGLLTSTERRGEPFWGLTDIGRERLEAGRESGEVDDLPEPPQHRAWRHARVKAAVRIEGFRQDLNDAVAEANRRLDQLRPVMAREWFEVREQLRLASWRLASATYCLTEWPEPEDGEPDVDETLDPGRGAGRSGPGMRTPRVRREHERASRRTAQRLPAAPARAQSAGAQPLDPDRDAA
jgi:hypothetical protein